MDLYLASGSVFSSSTILLELGRTDTSIISALNMFLFTIETFKWSDVVILGECPSFTRLQLQHGTCHICFVVWPEMTQHLSGYLVTLEFFSAVALIYLLALLEILSEIQMTGLQSYRKGRLQMGIWSVFTMAGSSMVLVLVSKSHRSNLHSECKNLKSGLRTPVHINPCRLTP